MPKKTKSNKAKIIIISVVGALVIAGGIVTAVIIANQPPREYNSSIHSEQKDNIKKHIKEVTIGFHSYPHEVSVIYNFEDKTKTIERDTDKSSEKETEKVSYNRFDELYDVLYDKVFTNEEDIHEHSDCCAIESNYDIYVDFDTSDRIETLSENFWGYKNSNTGRYYWGLNGHKRMSEWDLVMKVAEINDSTFGSNKFSFPEDAESDSAKND